MEAINELEKIKMRLETKIGEIRSELDAVNIAMELLRREGSSQGASKVAIQARFAHKGLADSCREIVGGEFVSAIFVRDQLRDGGYRNQTSSLLNSVYATLNRLADNGEMDRQKVDGKSCFRKKARIA